MPSIHPLDSSKHLHELLDSAWKKERGRAERGGGKPSLLRALVWAFAPLQMPAFVYVSIEGACKILQAFYLQLLIESFGRPGNDGWVYGTAMVLAGLLLCFSHHQ
jgi:hypothetical protein